MIDKLSKAWKAIFEYLEHGNLVILIVLVSAVHYALILQTWDTIAVAIAIGLMVDLGHYRTVKAAVRYRTPKPTKDDKRSWFSLHHTGIIRWAMALFFTAIAISYQMIYYDGDIRFALPLPLLIVGLAWLSETNKAVGTKRKSAKRKPAQRTPAPKPTKRKPKRMVGKIPCPDCGKMVSGQPGLAGHKQHCPAVNVNGRKERVTV